MPWTCPECGRSFRNTNQDHSCELVPLSHHLANKPPHIVALTQDISAYILSLDDEIRQVIVPGAILFTTTGNFIALKPAPRWLQIEFNLQNEFPYFPIYKSQKVTKTKWCHFLRIDQPDDFNAQLKAWLREAWEISVKIR